MGIKITRIEFEHWMGIATAKLDVGPGGVVLKGKNGGGKTSHVKGLLALLTGQGLDATAIQIGADRAILKGLLDDGATVRRVGTANGWTLQITTADDSIKKKPQTWLDAAFPNLLDPMALLASDTPEKRRTRRARILAVMPMAITIEQLRQWVPGLPDTFDVAGHGLDVLKRLEASAYERRTAANAKAEADAAEATRVKAEVPPAPEGEPVALHVALAGVETASAAVAALCARDREAVAAVERTKASRERADALRAEADTHETGQGVPDATMDSAVEAEHNATLALENAENELRAAQGRRDVAALAQKAATERIAFLDSQSSAHQAALAKVKGLRSQAADIEATIAAASVSPVTPEEHEAAAEAHTSALAVHATARAHVAHDTATAVAETRAKAATASKAEADRLHAVVKALRDDAPAALLATSDGIPGLKLDGDDVLLDGVSLDRLCGSERIKFAVRIAERANKGAGLVICDGLEALDPDQYDAFLAQTAASGMQVIGTRVDRGAVVYEMIEATPTNGSPPAEDDVEVARRTA